MSSWKKWAARRWIFFVRVRTKYRTFPRATHTTTNHLRTIDHRNHVRRPPICRMIAIRSIQSHHRCLPSPPSSPMPSNLLWSRWNSLHSGRRLGEDGSSLSSAQFVPRRGNQWTDWPPAVRVDSIGNWGIKARRGNTTINWVGRYGHERDTTIWPWISGPAWSKPHQPWPQTQQSTTQ